MSREAKPSGEYDDRSEVRAGEMEADSLALSENAEIPAREML